MSEKETRRGGEAADHGHLAAWSAIALLIALFTGIPAVASVAAAMPMTIRGLRGRPAPGIRVLTRWALTVWFIGTALAAMGGTRALGAIATGPWAQRAAAGWLQGSGDAVPSLPIMLGASLALAATVLFGRGIAGPIVLAETILFAAVSAATIYAHAFNVFSAFMVAFPVWTLAWMAGGCVLIGSRSPSIDEAGKRRAHVLGLSLLAVAIVLRFATEPIFTRLARELTAS